MKQSLATLLLCLIGFATTVQATPKSVEEAAQCPVDFSIYENPPAVRNPHPVSVEAYRLGANPVVRGLDTPACRAELARRGYQIKKAGTGEVCGPMMDGGRSWYTGGCLAEGEEYFSNPDRPTIAAALGCGNIIMIPPPIPAPTPPPALDLTLPEVEVPPPALEEPPPVKKKGGHKKLIVGGIVSGIVAAAIVAVATSGHHKAKPMDSGNKCPGNPTTCGPPANPHP